VATDPVSAGVGLMSLFMGNQQANDQKKMAGRGLKMEEQLAQRKIRSMDKQWELAEGYDPEAETAAAMKFAEGSAQASFGQKVKDLVAGFAKGGAMPGLSSEWGVRMRGAAERSFDPLKAFAAERAGTNFQRKMNAYAQAGGAIPGQLGDAYFKYASMMPGGNMSGGLGMLMQGLSGAFKKGGGSGGSGDYRFGLGDGASDGWQLGVS
jgi:hypothetical protein